VDWTGIFDAIVPNFVQYSQKEKSIGGGCVNKNKTTEYFV